MEMIGRKREAGILESALRDDRPHFIAVYGRRRIGKTFLIRETFHYRFTFQHAGIYQGTMREEIKAFQHSIMEANGSIVADGNDWLDAFENLKYLIQNATEKKKVVFLDELSWMDTPKSDFLKALENFWNAWASARNDVVLIVCASATSWMLSKIIHNKGGLYNRLTEQIHLNPFCLSECEEYVHAMGLTLNRSQILQYYMAFGGVPYYWSFLKKGESPAQTIDRILFGDNAVLKDEFQYLYASIFRKPESYLKIIKALAARKSGLTREEIAVNTGLANSGALSTRLEELESCGFVRKYKAFGMKSKNAIYQLIDFFTLFYYQFLASAPTDPHFYSDQLNTPKINTWCGLAFEKVCLCHIAQMKQRLGIAGVYTDVNAWNIKADPDRGIIGSQIDLLIVRKDQVINLCEMKYADSEYTVTKKVDMSIRNKISDLRNATHTRYAIFPTLVTTYGLVDNSYSSEIQFVITLEDLFMPLITL